MAAVNDFIVQELYENTAIIGADNTIIFTGNSFSKILSEKELQKLISSPINDINSLSSIIKEVQTKRKSLSCILDVDIKIMIHHSGNGTLLLIGNEAVEQVLNLEHKLRERIKELECLYSISSELDKVNSPEDFIKAIIPVITDAFQHPENIYLNIEVDNKIYGDINWNPEEITSVLNTGIERNGKKRGEVRVYGINNVDFLKEEEKLLNEIAVRISRLFEKEEKHNNFEKQQKILTAKNEALLKVTQECYEKREKLRTFFRAITDNIVVIDREFNISMSNKDSIGDSGKCYSKLFNQQQPCDKCPALITFNSAQDYWNDKEITKRNYRLWTYPIFGIEGEVEKVLEVCRDITDQKEIETKLIQSYKLASLGKLVAGVAHEINNPNTFILGNLKIIKEAFDDIFPILDTQYKSNDQLEIARLDYNIFKDNITILVNDMLNGANRTKKIVADLRNFAKKDEDQLTEIVDLNDIIKNNLTLTQKHIKKYAKLEIELCEDLPLFNGNINKLEQVLLNLTMNASESIEEGEGIVKIITDYDDVGKEILLIVSDNGSGMDDSTLKKIFDPFFTTKRNKGGTGLGLSITYGIIKDHNGRIDVKSKPGEGTTFIIHIPVKEKKIK